MVFLSLWWLYWQFTYCTESYEIPFVIHILNKRLMFQINATLILRMVLSNETSMYQLKDRHGLIISLVLSLTVYAQLPLLALDFRHGIQNESSSQRKGGNKHERYG